MVASSLIIQELTAAILHRLPNPAYDAPRSPTNYWGKTALGAGLLALAPHNLLLSDVALPVLDLAADSTCIWFPAVH
jgi:hypothetical protein